MSKRIRLTMAVALVVLSQFLQADLQAAPVEEVRPDSRCAVCGMFVAKYANWLGRVRHADGTVSWFDGAKDMLAYYFNPGKFGSQSPETITEISVKDYYTLQWQDGLKAYYVIGSDVHGPMGHELIPFSSRQAADAFLKDHHGERVLTFSEITPAQVEAMRSGQMMKKDGGGMKHGKH